MTDHDKQYKVAGYVKYCTAEGCATAASAPTPNPAVGDSTDKFVKLVSKAYVDDLNKPTTNNNNSNPDGAMALGTFAAATAAATCALLF